MTEKAFINYLNPRFIFPFILMEIYSVIIGTVVICFYVVVIVLCIPLYLYRYVLTKVTPLLNPTMGKMVTTRGQFMAIEDFTSSEISPRSNIVASLGIQGFISLEQIQEKITQNLIEMKDCDGKLKHPELTQYMTSYGGFKYWKPDTHFSINNHVQLYKQQFGSHFTKDQLRDLLELLLNQPFQPKQSPWQIFIVNDYINPEICSESMTLVLLKVHHSVADGIGATFTFIPALSHNDKLPVIAKANYATCARGKLRILFFNLTYLFRMIREISNIIVVSLKHNPLKIKYTRKLLYTNSPTIPIKQIKETKSNQNVSFTSVIHSCIAASIQKLFDKKFGNKKALKFKNMPCVMLLPLPNHPLKLRNYCTGTMICLPISKMGSIERLRQCEEDLVAAKKSTMPLLGKILPIIYGGMIEPLARFFGKNRFFPVSLSNFSLSEIPFEVCGKKVVNVNSTAGTAVGVASLGFLVHSYVENIQISVVGEQGIFSREDLDFIVNAIMDEMQILYNESSI